jgi:hypothetical protein
MFRSIFEGSISLFEGSVSFFEDSQSWFVRKLLVLSYESITASIRNRENFSYKT